MGPANRKKKKKKEEELKKSKEIEEKMKKDLENENKEIKLLVLGTGESGKSTFLKQLMILYKGGFGKQDKALYTTTIRSNLISHTKILIDAINELGIEVKSKSKKIMRDFYEMEYYSSEDLTEEVQNQITSLWLDPGFKEAYDRRTEFQLPDTANFYLNNCERISDPKFEPTQEDILLCRIPTTGVNVIQFTVDDRPWQVVDVGGQRSERRKWIHQFDDVSIVLYVVATSEYNQKLYEDQTVNRMHESLILFDQTANGDFFKEKNCVVLFNKIDLLKQKIKNVDLKVCFPEYTSGKNYEQACEFIKQKFLEVGRNTKRTIFTHFTCATDTENMRGVFDAVTTTVLEAELKNEGYI
ncbi:guanine nucleotide-binding protein g(o) subunit alpha [Anaeramoeba flamelloides]|uniref:Guanine nucleotide-binding protein g(O) subunit alpha n=1 Tax=Anaeramoeba flamelloides TaxID=1746091 RepID=A0ABQ8YG45_9EUKA|nr:guanine nucleotide-binding protein g(o) subunit alpha [Anaeramoeba flamelloides]